MTTRGKRKDQPAAGLRAGGRRTGVRTAARVAFGLAALSVASFVLESAPNIHDSRTALGAGAPSEPMRVIAIDTGPGTSSSNIDVMRPNKLDVGDGFTETNVLLDGAKRVGRLELTCTILKIVREDPVNFHCTGLFFLAHGRVAMFGSLAGPRATYAVIGGTGRFATARGEVGMRNLSEHRTEWVLRLLT